MRQFFHASELIKIFHFQCLTYHFTLFHITCFIICIVEQFLKRSLHGNLEYNDKLMKFADINWQTKI